MTKPVRRAFADFVTRVLRPPAAGVKFPAAQKAALSTYGGIMRKALIAALAVSFMAGCSSVQMAQAPEDNVDYLYITAVEIAAKRYGTEVVWMNLPLKRQIVTQ